MADDKPRSPRRGAAPNYGAKNGKAVGVSRREVIAGAGAVSLGLSGKASAELKAGWHQTDITDGPLPAARPKPSNKPYNVILFISDEETYRLRPAEGYTLPARAGLQNTLVFN